MRGEISPAEPTTIVVFYGMWKMSNIFDDISKKLKMAENAFAANSLTIFLK